VTVAAVVLAAGASSRMGHPKQVLRYGDHSLLRHATVAALGAACSPAVVVTGAHAELSRRELAGLDVSEVFNAQWESGMASSIRAGLEGLLRVAPSATAAVFLLCDQPLVTAEVIAGLIEARRATGSPLVASAYGGSFGVPALFDRSFFGELARLDGRAGAKQVIEKHLSEAQLVPFAGGEIDIDTPDDLARLVSRSGAA
jgi:molybdenum cofactor cytidylyltransferase